MSSLAQAAIEHYNNQENGRDYQFTKVDKAVATGICYLITFQAKNDHGTKTFQAKGKVQKNLRRNAETGSSVEVATRLKEIKSQ
ncbi:hypothetical protein Leryth_012780 [Lithospermum erythrorhizon]|nr:hypothetical protein Leryth_012780 [Lithospermum erythrorhizon]